MMMRHNAYKYAAGLEHTYRPISAVRPIHNVTVRPGSVSGGHKSVHHSYG